MSELIVITYPDPARAATVLADVARLQLAHLIDLDDACYVTKEAGGRVELHHASNLAAEGAVDGAFWGMLIGLVFLNPIVGGVIGAAEGALLASTGDYAITSDFVDSVAQQMTVDSSALFILVRQVTTSIVAAELATYGGTIVQTSFPQEIEDKWKAAFGQGTAPVATAPATVVAADDPAAEI